MFDDLSSLCNLSLFGLNNSVVKLYLAKISDFSNQISDKELIFANNIKNQHKRNEFITGRFTLRLAIDSLNLNLENYIILKGESGEPLIPKEIKASLSHCKDFALAIASNSKQINSLGIDIESFDRKIKDNLIGRVIKQTELDALNTNESTQQKLIRIFSAKEALYKGLFTIDSQTSFTDIEVLWDGECFIQKKTNFKVLSSIYNETKVISITCMPHFQS